jgi:hypothetical protein
MLTGCGTPYLHNGIMSADEEDATNFEVSPYTVNVDFLRIKYMVLAKYQHMSILELILLVKQHILILCKNLLGVAVLIVVNVPLTSACSTCQREKV